MPQKAALAIETFHFLSPSLPLCPSAVMLSTETKEPLYRILFFLSRETEKSHWSVRKKTVIDVCDCARVIGPNKLILSPGPDFKTSGPFCTLWREKKKLKLDTRAERLITRQER